MASRKRSSSSSTPRSRRAPAGLETTKEVGSTVRQTVTSDSDTDASGKQALRWNVARDKALLKVLRDSRDENEDGDGGATLTPTEVAQALKEYADADGESPFSGVEHLLNAQAVSVRARRLRKADEGSIDVPSMSREGGYSPSADLLND